MQVPVLLLNPPYLSDHGKFSRSQRSPAITKAGTFYYPVWLANAAGVIEQAGFPAKLVDGAAKRMTLEQVLDVATDFAPQLLVVETSTPSIYNDIRVAAAIKERCNNPYVVLVGSHPSALPEETLGLHDGIDAVVRGEYDYTIRDLAQALSEMKPDLSSIAGLSFKNGLKVYHNPNPPLIQNLDELPFVSEVYKHHLDISDYFFGGAQYPMVMVMSSRGCPNLCVWCVWPQMLHGQKFRARSPQNVVDEMEYIVNELPEVKDIAFEDDTFTADQNRVDEICDLILERKLKVSWYCNVRVNTRLKTLQKMKAAGCRFVIVGFESGNQKILKRMKKGISVKGSRRFMADARKAGLLVHGCFVAGNIGETSETLHETLDLALELNPDTAQFFPMMVYPGTEAYQWAKDNGYIDTHDFSKWVTETGLHNSVVNTPELSAREVVEWCDYARRKYYLRPRYVCYKAIQTLFSPTERTRNLKQLRNFYKYLIKGSFWKSFPSGDQW